jgi:hypothetical protein
MRSAVFGLVGGVMVAAGGCGSGETASIHVSGTVDPEARRLTGARAVATATSGRTYSAAIARSGRFALELPVGTTYRLVIANRTRSGQLRVVGHLVNPSALGTLHVIAVRREGELSLGRLRPAGASGPPAAGSSGIRTAEHEADEAGEEEHGDDSAETNDDDLLCVDGDDVALEAEHAPDDDFDDVSASDGPIPTNARCEVHDGDHDGDDD